MTYLREQADHSSLSLAIHVQPKASRTRIAGLHGDALKLCITSPPVDGKANEAVIRFFAKIFNIPKSAITIVRGEASRDKGLLISGLTAAEAAIVLSPLLDRSLRPQS